MPSEFLKDVLSHLERLWQITGLTKFQHLWSFAILPLMIRAWCGSCIFDLFSPWCCQSCTSPHLRSSGQGSNKNVQHFTKSHGIECFKIMPFKSLLNIFNVVYIIVSGKGNKVSNISFPSYPLSLFTVFLKISRTTSKVQVKVFLSCHLLNWVMLYVTSLIHNSMTLWWVPCLSTFHIDNQ